LRGDGEITWFLDLNRRLESTIGQITTGESLEKSYHCPPYLYFDKFLLSTQNRLTSNKRKREIDDLSGVLNKIKEM
jgi:hypothetical protein